MKIIDFKKPAEPAGLKLKKQFCDCGQDLKYWLADETAYGLCDICTLASPVEITWSEEVEE